MLIASKWIQTQSVFGVHTINHDPLVPHLFRPTSSIYLTLNHFASSLQLSCDIHKHLCSEVQHISQTIHVRTFFFLSLFSDRAHHVSNTVLNNFNEAPPSILRASDELGIIILISYMRKLRHRI